MKYYITHESTHGFNKILYRIKSMPANMYDYYKCFPTKILKINNNGVVFHEGQEVIVFEGEKVEPVMRLLGFSFDLMFDDYERRVREVENYGKYQCITFEEDDVDLSKEQYTEIKFNI